VTELAVLTPCEHHGCKRWSHLRYCPEHATDEQRATHELLDEALVERDLARERYEEAGERVRVLLDELGMRQPDTAA
jgi:hypothetical protein